MENRTEPGARGPRCFPDGRRFEAMMAGTTTVRASAVARGMLRGGAEGVGKFTKLISGLMAAAVGYHQSVHRTNQRKQPTASTRIIAIIYSRLCAASTR